jgi:hypothetical protein
MFPGLRASITSAPSMSARVVLRAYRARSPIQLKTSRSRLMPYCDCSCCVAAAPPSAPATLVKIDFTDGPTSAAPSATHASPGSSPSNGVLPVPVSGPNALSASAPSPRRSESNAIRSPSASSAPLTGPSLSIGKIERNCSSCPAACGSDFSACSMNGLRST